MVKSTGKSGSLLSQHVDRIFSARILFFDMNFIHISNQKRETFFGNIGGVIEIFYILLNIFKMNTWIPNFVESLLVEEIVF